MKILVSGASGLIASALLPCLTSRGHETWRLTRGSGRASPKAIAWDPDAGSIDAKSLEDFDAVVHLAGENIAGGRWTAERKRRILESRKKGTLLLAESLSRLAHPPRVMISASAIGYYGDRGSEMLNEESAPGSGFLPGVCIAWEEATRSAAGRGIRVVTPRIGIVLTTSGGALARMLPPFRLGLGGKIGSGAQYMSWISLDDLVGVICQGLEDDVLTGAVNAVAPGPVTNLEFTRTLGRVLSRPTILPLPAFAARLMLGEMAQELLLASARVVPDKLIAAGYRFQHSSLEAALRSVLRV